MNILNNFKENVKKSIIETFLKDIKIYSTHIEIRLRLFPMDIASNGGDEELNILTIPRNNIFNNIYSYI